MSETANFRQAPPVADEPHEPSIGRLVSDASRDVSALIRQEIALVKSEVVPTLRMGGMAIGLFVGAAFLGLLAVILGSFFLVYLIALTGLNLAWCYLIVVVVYLIIAAILGLVGYRKVKAVKPPERSIAQAKEIQSMFSKSGNA